MYTINYLKSAEKYFKKIKDKHLLSAYKTAIDKLEINPYIGQQKSGDLRGIWCFDVKYAKTNYEIAYRIYEENGKLLVVILAGHAKIFTKN